MHQSAAKRTYNKRKQKDPAVSAAGTTSTAQSENAIKSPIGCASILTSPNRLKDVKAKLAAPVPVGEVSRFLYLLFPYLSVIISYNRPIIMINRICRTQAEEGDENGEATSGEDPEDPQNDALGKIKLISRKWKSNTSFFTCV